MKINRYRLKSNITKEDLLSAGFKEENCSFIMEGGKLYKSKHNNYKSLEYTIYVAFTDNLSKFNDLDNILVLDEDFCQPYTPFYKYWNRDVTDFDILEGLIKDYNSFMDSIPIFEKLI